MIKSAQIDLATQKPTKKAMKNGQLHKCCNCINAEKTVALCAQCIKITLWKDPSEMTIFSAEKKDDLFDVVHNNID